MAFVGRARRADFFGGSTSGPDVGPGSYFYDGAAGGTKSGVKYSIPPFSSSCERAVGGEGDRGFHTPGPGYYTTTDTGQEIAVRTKSGNQSSQFASRTTRLIADTILQKKALTPGPGSYASLEKWSDTQNKSSHHCADPSPRKTQGNVAWAKVATAPSIPAPSQSYGYEEGGRGELIQGKAPPNTGYGGRPGDQAGPGAYSPDDSLIRPKATALSFGKSKSARACAVSTVSKEVAARPGPGSYNSGAVGGNHQNANVGTSGFASATERNFVPKNAGALPGPGHYQLKSSFESRAFAVAQAAVAPTQPLPAHKDKQKPTPGPGHYQAASEFEGSRGRGKSDKSGGFSSTSLRFTEGGGNRQTPGPGYYSDGTVGQTAMSASLGKRVSGRYGVFGTTSQRFVNKSSSLTAGALAAPTASLNVGPGTYDPKADVNPAEVRKRDTRNSVFVSKVRRLDRPKEVTPGVGEYELTSTMGDKKANGRLGGAFFLANEVRFKPTKPSGTPGPGNYQQDHNTVQAKVTGVQVTDKAGQVKTLANAGANDSSGTRRPLCDRAARFPKSKEGQLPGPGYYETGSSLMRRTFNITIGDSWD